MGDLIRYMAKSLQGHDFLALSEPWFKLSSCIKIRKGRNQAQKGKGLVKLSEREALIMNSTCMIYS